MLKRLFCTVLCVVAASLFAGTVSAQEYKLDEMQARFTLPEQRDTFTRGTSSDDPAFANQGVEPEALLTHMKNNSMYLISTTQEYAAEIIVTMTASDASKAMGSLDDASESEVSMLVQQAPVTMTMAIPSVEFNNSELFTSAQGHRYIEMRYTQTQDDEMVYSHQYTTVQNGQTVNITLHSYGQEIPEPEDAVQLAMVDSAVFVPQQTADRPAVTDAAEEKIEPASAAGKESEGQKALKTAVAPQMLVYALVVGVAVAVITVVCKKKKEQAPPPDDFD